MKNATKQYNYITNTWNSLTEKVQEEGADISNLVNEWSLSN